MVNKSRVSLEMTVISKAASCVPAQFIGRRTKSPITPAEENNFKLHTNKGREVREFKKKYRTLSSIYITS